VGNSANLPRYRTTNIIYVNNFLFHPFDIFY
jgi:hypothetical protein